MTHAPEPLSEVSGMGGLQRPLPLSLRLLACQLRCSLGLGLGSPPLFPSRSPRLPSPQACGPPAEQDGENVSTEPASSIIVMIR